MIAITREGIFIKPNPAYKKRINELETENQALKEEVQDLKRYIRKLELDAAKKIDTTSTPSIMPIPAFSLSMLMNNTCNGHPYF